MITNPFNLEDLDGNNGFIINGIDAKDRSGYSVSNAGDINGDGKDDLIIGAKNTDPNGNSYSGESYVVFGKNDFSSLGATGFSLSDLDGNNGFIINGRDRDDYSGRSVSNAGDVNGDGKDDLIIGAFGADPNGNGNAGESYVLFGKNDFSSLGTSGFSLSDLDGNNGFIINGIDAYDSSGRSVSNAGDVNGDGKDDIIIGASSADPNGSYSGESYVVFGKNDFSSLGATGFSLSDLDGNNGFIINGRDRDDYSGRSVSNAGDVNGDGKDDLIIGAYGADPNGSTSGESYVLFGKNDFFSLATSGFSLSDLDGNNGFIINGIDAYDASGIPVSNAGDVNGDGKDDLIIGAGGADPFGSASGESYVLFGKNDFSGDAVIELSNLDGNNGFIINGIDSGDYSGYSVSNAGDVNGDGKDDLIIGATGADPNGSTSGESYVLFGKNDFSGDAVIELSSLDGNNGFIINGIDVYDSSGFSVSNAGDVNGDGKDDLIIGATGADPNGSLSGESYVVFGQGEDVAFESPMEFCEGRAVIINGIDASDHSGVSVSNAGDVNGDGKDDIIIAANKADPHGSNSGESYVVFGRSDFSSVGVSGIDLSSLNGNNGFIIKGIDASDHSGVSVSNAGDVNGDGKDDIIIGAAQAGPHGSVSGESYVLFGKNDFSSLGATGFSLSDLDGNNGFIINGIEAFDHSGVSVSNAGDVNGDGKDDLIIGAYLADPNSTNSGESYVVFGRSDFSSVGMSGIDLSSLDGNNGFIINGIDASDWSGLSVSAAGDVNDDGKDDIIIGASGADPNGSYSGESYVVFGRSDFSSVGARGMDLSSLDGNNGFIINGIDASDNAGYSVSAAGDVNGDGKDDIIIGAYGLDSHSGGGYVVFGRSDFSSVGMSGMDLSSLDGNNGFIINGIDSGDKSGYSVSNAGDVNRDGKDDIIIGAYGADPNGVDSGEVYVVFGRSDFSSVGMSGIDISNLDGNNGFVINGIDSDDKSGYSVSNAGDVNGDGKDDLIIGAPYADPNGASSGESYVVFPSLICVGEVTITPNKILVTSAGTYIGTTGDDKFIINTSFNVSITTLAGADQIVVYPDTGGNIDITDFDYSNDKILYLAGDANFNCSDIIIN